jgi:hypothetical protein
MDIKLLDYPNIILEQGLLPVKLQRATNAISTHQFLYSPKKFQSRARETQGQIKWPFRS